MNPENIKSVLAFNREILSKALPSFIRSIEKCRSLELTAPIPFEVEESFDALTSKFSRVSDIFTQKVLKSFVILIRDPRHPVHQIADQLLPYLRILVDQFHPEQVILFGSHAYGQPTRNSDVDLLIVKPIREGRVKDKVAIRRAWWPLLLGSSPLSFDILLTTPEEFHSARWADNGYHAEIHRHGLRVA